ncbi:hypothetical protein DPEC_G00106180 [Dallia pectoralis]|uniref:Uncharacterized protein n=1 Tax=Dallia pectoralis TaxID=75939 RepID=A0ACC2GYG8_DALPE|nr:hypothetical protein DPEC_G00106180 [Dallia pectoralis]
MATSTLENPGEMPPGNQGTEAAQTCQPYLCSSTLHVSLGIGSSALQRGQGTNQGQSLLPRVDLDRYTDPAAASLNRSQQKHPVQLVPDLWLLQAVMLVERLG